MEVAISIIKGYLIFVIVIMLVYAIRHFIFAVNRFQGRQRMYYGDIYTSKMKRISVLVPMHNEELVLDEALKALLNCDYDRDMLEIIPINDNSTDRTKEMLDDYHRRYEFIRPLHRDCPDRGKPVGLNEAMQLAEGEIIVVFDADYRPARNLLKQLVIAFEDPEVGAVMGRVIPYNARKNILTRLINIERSGGYQVDQQARYNMRLIPQYGGTVGAFRKDVMLEMGGFDTAILAEDTDLTFKMYRRGWKVMYANSAECYEEAPESWSVRARQIRRWARGHNQVMWRQTFPLLFSRNVTAREKLDGFLLLLVYAVPVILLFGHICSYLLFFMGEMDIFSGWWVLLFLGTYCSFGNFAPFYEIGVSLMLDGIKGEVFLLPLLLFNFYFYMWAITQGFFDSIADLITKRKVKWAKTTRFLNKGQANTQ